MTLDEIKSRAAAVTLASEHFCALTVALAKDVLAMLPLIREAELWQRQIIGERTSYDLRLEAAIDALRTTIAERGREG